MPSGLVPGTLLWTYFWVFLGHQEGTRVAPGMVSRRNPKGTSRKACLENPEFRGTYRTFWPVQCIPVSSDPIAQCKVHRRLTYIQWWWWSFGKMWNWRISSLSCRLSIKSLFPRTRNFTALVRKTKKTGILYAIITIFIRKQLVLCNPCVAPEQWLQCEPCEPCDCVKIPNNFRFVLKIIFSLYWLWRDDTK